MRLDFDLAKPIYMQIVDEVKRCIVRGELGPGEKMLSQREMAQSLKVNPNTVQRAYQEMERLELVETLRGEGTFVKNDVMLVKKLREEMASETLHSFLREMASLGFSESEVVQMVSESLGNGGSREYAGGEANA